MKKIQIISLIIIAQFSIINFANCQNSNQDIIINKSSLGPDPVLGSPKLRELDLHLNMDMPNEKKTNHSNKQVVDFKNANANSGNQNNTSNQGATLEELAKLTAKEPNSFDKSFEINTVNKDIEQKFDWVQFLIGFLILGFILLVIYLVKVESNRKENMNAVVNKKQNSISPAIDLNQQIKKLEKIHNLKEKGAITDEEYIKLKNQIL